VTAGGAIDSTFGDSGIAPVATAPGPAEFCNSMVAQADGRLLVAGKSDAQGFAARMLADGQTDPGFSADAVASALSDATAIAVDQDNSILVAGKSVSGGTIMRLQATGELDVLFGNAGSTLIDLHSESGMIPIVHDMSTDADGRVVAAGSNEYSSQAFVIRLLGEGGGDSPGVLGVAKQTAIPTTEDSNEVSVSVRRTGGATGTVSVAYQTVAGGSQAATEGEDYQNVSGRLTWADGDMAEQQIQIQILGGGAVEAYEYFQVALDDAQGGAGLGTSNATIEIAADGMPFGQLGFAQSFYMTRESRTVTVEVARNFYSSGAISVTLTPVSGTATAGTDFPADPVTLVWADGDSNWKTAQFAITDDTEEELNETFTVELSNATGGAVIGPQSTTTVSIARSDQPIVESKKKGGGAVEFLSLMLLGLMAFWRRIRIALVTRTYATRACRKCRD
jgi:uncharacterized delta-60 repeat protein